MSVHEVDEEKKCPDQIPKSDKLTITILFFLYTLQGIPLGLSDSVKLLLQNKNVSYKDQAAYSFVHWPFSIKLLWAPIVDSLYWKELGRRKSWIVPAQTVLGIIMVGLSTSVSTYLGMNDEPPDVLMLTIIFFSMNFIVATQDIAVDGWAITMLSRQNVGYASVCNTTGQMLGYFIGNTLFIILESPEFCNRYLRSAPQSYGVVTFSGFLKISGFIFLFSTMFILIFKYEEKEVSGVYEAQSVKETYFQLYHILCLKKILLLVTLLLTYQIAVAAAGTVTKLKFIEKGVSKEMLVLLEMPKSFVSMLLPFFISAFLVGLEPLNLFLKAFPYKIVFGLFLALLVWWTPFVKLDSSDFPVYYYTIIVLSFIVDQVINVCVDLPLICFFNKISDPSIGGTYMTLLNTCCNLGDSWTSTLALWGVDILTFKQCEQNTSSCNATTCLNVEDIQCKTIVDGYFVESVACALFGVLWLQWGRYIIHQLHDTSPSDWKTSQHHQMDSFKFCDKIAV